MKSVVYSLAKSGVDSVRSTRARSFLTMLGIIIGVASVITVVAIGNGIKHQVSGQIHHYGKDLITVRPAQLQTGGSNDNNLNLVAGLNTSAPLTDKDIGTVSTTRGVGASAPLTIAAGSVSGEHGSYNDGSVIGTTSDFASLVNQSMAYGNFLSNDDIGQNVAVLGLHASEKLFNEDVPLGHSFMFHGQRFIVRGIFNQFSASPLSQQLDFNNAVFIPNDVAESLSNNTAPTYEILVRPSSGVSTAAVVKNVGQALAKTHGGLNQFNIATGNESLDVSDSVLGLLTKLIGGVAAISLLVSGIGIMNVMLVSVAERKHEIGIRKAVGATNRQILSQFMIESTFLSLWGGIIGVIVAGIADLLLRAFTDLEPSISWQVIVLATGVSLLVGIVFGTVPAFKAARKDPIEALRSE